jgi:hypothetical protein
VYGWIWRHLPGNFPVKFLLSLLLLFAVLWLLFQHVFPWLDPRLPFNQIGPAGGATPTSP